MGLFDRASVNKRLFLILFTASIFGNIAILPYAVSLGLMRTAELPVPFSVAILIQIAHAVLFFSIAIFVGLFLGKKVGLGAPFIEDWLEGESVHDGFKSAMITSVVLGVVVGGLVFFLDRVVFAPFVEPVTVSQAQPALWQRFLASFYGGICEEIGMRLFFMTFIVWVSSIFRRAPSGLPTNIGVWIAILLISVIFGLGHLPMTARFQQITALVVFRAVLLNGIAGVVFGWLYWRKGLESAMISHFSTDITIHVILSSFIT
jgi:membrane protease YdiL (CAAX protease family)